MLVMNIFWAYHITKRKSYHIPVLKNCQVAYCFLWPLLKVPLKKDWIFSHFSWDQTHTLNCYFLVSSTWHLVRLVYATWICLILKKVTWNIGLSCRLFLWSRLKNTVTKFKSLLHLGVHTHNNTILHPTKNNIYKNL